MKISKEKLASLSKEEKLALLDAVEEKKRRKRAARMVYKPNEGQLRMHLSNARIRFNLSGNAAGKSTAAIQEAVWTCQGYNPVLDKYTRVPANVVIVLDSPLKVRDIYLGRNGIRKWFDIKEEQLHKDGKPQISRISFDNGSQITFMSQEMDELMFEGIEVDLAIADEPVPRNIFISLLRGGRTKGHEARFLMIGTPIGAKSTWVRELHQEWERGGHPEVDFFKMSSHVNKDNLQEGFLENFEHHLTERERESRIEGGFFSAHGLALGGLFDRKKHVVPASALPADHIEWPGVIAIDPHTAKDLHACLMLAGPNGQLVYVAEYKQKALSRDFAKWLKANWLVQYNVCDVVCDNFGSAQYTGGEAFASFIEVCNREGVRVRPTSYDEKKDEEFLTRLQEALYDRPVGGPKLKIVAGNNLIIHDCENVAWKPLKGTEDFQPKLEISNRDALACLKYALAAGLTYDNSKRRIIRPSGAPAKPKHVMRRQEAGARRLPSKFEERMLAKGGRKRDDWDDF